MQTGLLLNGLICLIVAVVAFWVSKIILNKEKKEFVDFLLFGFWLSVGLTWLLVGVGLFLYENGYPSYDFILNRYGVQAFIFIQLSFGVAYALYRAYQKRLVGIVSLVGCLVFSGIGYYFLTLPGGFLLGEGTYFSVEYWINSVSWNFFQFILGTGVTFLAYDIFKYLFRKIKDRGVQPRYFLVSISILVYSIIGYFDNQGINATWIMVLFRSIIVLSILLTYLAYTQEDSLEDQ